MDTLPPVRVAVIDDYEVIVRGTAEILKPHRDLVEVVDLTVDDDGPSREVDVALLDCFGTAEAHNNQLDVLAANPNANRVAIFTWNFAPALIDRAFQRGASGYLSKALPGDKLAEALVAIHRGEAIVSNGDVASTARRQTGRDWPGRGLGLTEREAEVLALLTQGKSLGDIADALFLSINSVKTHTRNLYRKLNVNNRTEAALWGVDHGFRPDHNSRIEWQSSTERSTNGHHVTSLN